MKLEVYLILGLILCVAAVMGCTSNTDNFSVKHFENEHVSFDYPDNWTVTVIEDLSDYPTTEWMIRIENPKEKIASVVISEVEPAFQANSGSPSSLKIDGRDTLESSDNSTFRMYTFSKNNKSYEIIVYGSNTSRLFKDSVFTKYQAHYDTIINSIQIK